MDAKLKAEWIAALRSGQYKQAREALRDGDGYCCLGVLCLVAGISLDGRREDDAGYQPIFDLVGNAVVSRGLAMRNDGNGAHHEHSFSEIADYIEQTL